MIPFHCTRCGTTVFFENTHCGTCGALLGYVPAERRMASFDPAEDTGTDTDTGPSPGWLRLHGTDAAPDTALRLRPCDNRVVHQVCNWMLDDGDEARLCISCRLTEVIPSLEAAGNLRHWAAIERAKRRLVYTLMALGLTPQPRGADGVGRGLCFQLLESLPGGPAVMTGHDEGVITLNIAEADDVHREATRVAMGEPVRTLLGHLRHEVSHYLAWRHVGGTPAMARCRELFGDDGIDYTGALQTHYAQGAPADWPLRYVSAYASAHPYEDWAETCAHYLLVVDALETASAWGLQLDGPSPTRAADGADTQQPLARRVLAHWLPLAQFLNAMNRSLGHADSYPFLLPPAVLDKMALVQTLLAEAAAPADTPPPGPPGAPVSCGSTTPAPADDPCPAPVDPTTPPMDAA